MTTKMDPKLKARWLEALRSGKYKKARYALNRGHNRMCCLGVLADIQGEEWEPSEDSPLFSIDGWSSMYYRGLPGGSLGSVGSTLAHINDHSTGYTKVIEYIEENL